MPNAPILQLTADPRRAELDLCAWVGNAPSGTVLVYHRGDLLIDRTRAGQFGNTATRMVLARLATRAMDLAERGLVHLVQRRFGPHDYAYYLIVRAPHRGFRGTQPVGQAA